jgi:hypothetical protein
MQLAEGASRGGGTGRITVISGARPRYGRLAGIKG